MTQATLVIVGRPNVGKSTLFNRLTRSQQALVADTPGVTRDRQYGQCCLDGRFFWLVDTGGVCAQEDSASLSIRDQLDQQFEVAVTEADVVLFMVDSQAGLLPDDELIAQRLRCHTNKPVLIVANKADHDALITAGTEFYGCGFPDVLSISVKRSRGLGPLMQRIHELSPIEQDDSKPTLNDGAARVAVLGRPNVGKSTLMNRLLGDDRLVVSDEPGTTRDSIMIPCEHHGQSYVFVDTAGVRRRSRITDDIEWASIHQAMKTLDHVDIVLMMIHAVDGVTDQDLRLLRLILLRGRGVVLLFNQWDRLDDVDRQQFLQEVDRRLPFVDFARRYHISALHGSGLGNVYRAVDEAMSSLRTTLTTSLLTKTLEEAVKRHQPPLVQGRRVRLRYAHVGGRSPMTVVVHGKQVNKLPQSYKRYLSGFFRKVFGLVGVPLLIQYRQDDNPFQPESA